MQNPIRDEGVVIVCFGLRYDTRMSGGSGERGPQFFKILLEDSPEQLVSVRSLAFAFCSFSHSKS